MIKRAVVLLSGGVDSSTMLAMAAKEGRELFALSFRYGQRHAAELEAAAAQAKRFGAREHRIIDIDLRAFGGSALTADIAVPKDRTIEQMGASIPITYVPARNTVFLSYAVAWAEVLEAGEIFIGVNALDHAGYPDCRPEFIEAFERMANLATRAAVSGANPLKIRAPLLWMSKRDIIRAGLELGVDFGHTSSCYDPTAGGAPCGRCDSCALRLDAFRSLGREDPRAAWPVGEARP